MLIYVAGTLIDTAKEPIVIIFKDEHERSALGKHLTSSEPQPNATTIILAPKFIGAASKGLLAGRAKVLAREKGYRFLED